MTPESLPTTPANRPSSSRRWRHIAAFVGVLALTVLLLELVRPLPAPSASGGGRLQRGAWELIEREPTHGWRELRREGREPVVLEARPSRVVSQALAGDEVLFGLGAEAQVVAASAYATNRDYSLCADSAGGYPAVTGGSEQILSLRPDLVLAAIYSSPQLLDQLERAHVPVVVLSDFDSIDGILNNALVVGFCVGKDAEAERLVEEGRRRIATARGLIAQGGGPPLRVLSWNAGFLEAKGSVFSDIASELGLVDIPTANGLEGWPAVGAEQIATWDPDYLFTRAKPGEEDAVRQTLLDQPALAASRLGREPGRIIVLPSSLGSTVSHHVAECVELVATRLVASTREPR